MIKTAQEGLENYKKALKDYKAWVDGLNKRYDAFYGKGKWDIMGCFSRDDYDEINKSNVQLKAMVEILGLNKEEETAINKECGIKSPKKKKKSTAS